MVMSSWLAFQRLMRSAPALPSLTLFSALPSQRQLITRQDGFEKTPPERTSGLRPQGFGSWAHARGAPNSQSETGILSKRNRSVLVYPLAPIWGDPWPFFFSGVPPSPGSAPRAAPITPDQATLMLIRALLCLAHAVTSRPT